VGDDPFADMPLDVLRTVNERCNRYEADRKAGRLRPVDDYLADLSDEVRSAVRKELEALAASADLPTFRDYEVIDVLGRGGMATVYLARDRALQKLVAVKALRPDLLTDPAARMRLYREARAAAGFDHPNVIPIYAVAEEAGQPFLVFPYLEGEDLRTLVRRDGLVPVRQAVAYVRQAARGLAYVHAQGFVHRDVKPANLFLKSDGTVVVLDLGLVRAPAESDPHRTVTGMMLGTPAFAAPEQAASAGVGPPADVFALGGVLHFLLTGRPFEGTISPGLPGRVSRPLRRMLALDPAGRPAMADVDRWLRKPSPVARLAVPAGLAVGGVALLAAFWPRPPVPRPTPTIEDVSRVDPVAYRSAWAEHLGVPVEFTSDEGVPFVLVPPGTLTLDDEDGPRILRLAKPAYVAPTELTVGQTRAIVAATGFESYVERRARLGAHAGYVFRNGEWSIGEGGSWKAAGPARPLADDEPAINLIWDDAEEICRRLTDRKPGGPRYRLPTPDEWEYASRAGRTTRWPSGGDPLGWYVVYGTPFPAAVKGLRRPNAWGLYDMCGNVSEWCGEPDPARDLRTMCGGRMIDGPDRVTCAARTEEHRHAPLGGLRLWAEPGR
jgi:formylglycine-generating enzyme required for sulfatase activity/tRNA A-37 threonylcarbamoyl transferase component Bud32